MAAYAIWLDKKEAKIFKLIPAPDSDKTKKSRIFLRKDIRQEALPDESMRQLIEQKFFDEVADHVSDATELLILGPGLGKSEFKKHLERNHHSDLARSVIGVEPMEIPSDPHILAVARKFFKNKQAMVAA